MVSVFICRFVFFNTFVNFSQLSRELKERFRERLPVFVFFVGGLEQGFVRYFADASDPR